MRNNQKGFGIIEALVIVVVVGLIGGTGWYVYQKNKKDDKQTNTQATTQSENQGTEEEKKDPNEGYLVAKEWGLRFKVPSDLTDVTYRVSGDLVAFYAKPKGYNVEYRSDYQKITDNDFAPYALGSLYRSIEGSKDKMGDKVEGKKMGDYYYYTMHAFSPLATGAGANGLFSDAACDVDPGSAGCDTRFEAEQKAFQSVNVGIGALLNTIEAAK